MNSYYKSLGSAAAKKEFQNNKNIVNSLYKRPIKDVGLNVPHFNILKPNIVQQADLMFLPNDEGYKYVLVIVDCYSRISDAEPLKKKTAKAVVKAFKKIYKRGILKIPQRLEVDNGAEFRKDVKDFFKSQGTYVRVAETGRHRQQAMVEKRNQLIQVPLWKNMIIKELSTGKTNKEWVDDLPNVVKDLNKKAEKHPPQKLPDKPVAEGSSQTLLDIGTKVRVLLDNPQDIVGTKLHGKFRSVDFKWSPEIRTIKNVLLMPGQPPMYQLDGNFTNENLSKVTYTKNQLQVVPANEQKKELKEEKPKKDVQMEKTEEKKIPPKKPIDWMIGKKVSFLWTDPPQWFNGVVTKKLPRGLYEVTYDDGDVRNHKFLETSKNITWRFI